MTVTVTPTVEAANIPPRVRLDVAATTETQTTLTRLDPDGTTSTVRTYDGNPLPISGGVALLYDYEPQYQALVSYSSLETPATVSAQVTIPESRVWLIHPGVPALSQPVTAVSFTTRLRKATRGVFNPQGRRNAVVQTDGQRKAPTYTLTIRTISDDDRAAIDDLIDDAGVLLLNVPASKGWGIGAEYVSIGDSGEDRLWQHGAETRRNWALPCTVVDAPVGGSQSERTLLDLLDYPTLNSLVPAYPTFNALLAGP